MSGIDGELDGAITGGSAENLECPRFRGQVDDRMALEGKPGRALLDFDRGMGGLGTQTEQRPEELREPRARRAVFRFQRDHDQGIGLNVEARSVDELHCRLARGASEYRIALSYSVGGVSFGYVVPEDELSRADSDASFGLHDPADGVGDRAPLDHPREEAGIVYDAQAQKARGQRQEAESGKP